MPGYTQVGPFTDNSAPGIDKNFLNGLETWIRQAEGDTGYVSVTGTTAGTATLYQILQGTFKAFFLYYSGYRNSTATEQQVALPTAFTTYALFFANGGIPITHIYSSGSQLTNKCNVITGLPSGGGAGSISTQSAMNGYSSGEITSGFDHIGLGVSLPQNFTAGLFIIGI